MRAVRVNDRIRITSDNEAYDPFRDRLWVVELISYSVKDHPGYDSDVGGPLIDCYDLPVSLYDWEFEIITGTGTF